jgi:hypothetical protein
LVPFQVETQDDLVIEDLAGAHEAVLLVEPEGGFIPRNRTREQGICAGTRSELGDDGVERLRAIPPALEALVDQKTPEKEPER